MTEPNSRLQSFAEEIEAAWDRWWREQTRRGDPARNPNLVREAFEAAYLAGSSAADNWWGMQK